MKKAVISVFLVLTLVLNVFGFGVLEARSSAVGVAATLAFATLVVIAGAVTGVAANLSAQVLATIPENVLTNVNNQAIQNGEVIQILESGGDYYFAPVSGLDSDTAEFASFFCDYLNNSENTTLALNSFLTSLNGGMAAANYAAFKTDAVNAFLAYTEMKKRNLAISEGLEALEEATGEAWSAPYAFDFQRPISPIEMQQSINRMDSINVDGIQFIAPIIIDSLGSQGFPSQAYCNARGLINLSGNDSIGYKGYYPALNHYGGGNYILYNNDIYYDNCKWHQETAYTQAHVNSYFMLSSYSTNLFGSNMLNAFKNASGVSLSSAGCTSAIGLYSGNYYWTEPGTNPVPAIEGLTDASFTSTTPGDTINYDLTDPEKIIAEAIGLEIVSDDPEIEFDEEGNIATVDGIDLSVLENLVQELLNHTYDFSSFEEYLQTITALLQASNANTDQISSILTRLREWESTQSNALNAINTNVAAIADALTQTYEVDDDVETQDTYIVEHAGLTEANTLVNTAMPFVGQMRTLINNLFDPNNFNNTPPNFYFYADFDNDGVNERYNALDLSFLETRLTNDNLEDKGRYPQPVTVRELLQDILVLIVYSMFAFSMLKRIPSLINGSSSDEKNVINIRGD